MQGVERVNGERENERRGRGWSWKFRERGVRKKEILKIATLKRACTPQGIYVISSEGLPRILERSPGYAGGYLTLCIRALFPAVTGYTGCPRAKEMSLACDHARFLVISGVRPMCKAWVELLCLVIRLCDAQTRSRRVWNFSSWSNDADDTWVKLIWRLEIVKFIRLFVEQQLILHFVVLIWRICGICFLYYLWKSYWHGSIISAIRPRINRQSRIIIHSQTRVFLTCCLS